MSATPNPRRNVGRLPHTAEAVPPEIRNFRLLRDLAGYVHTPNGYMAGARYDQLRGRNPELDLPARHLIPLMSALSDDDLKRWYTSP